jgi:uncharacterized protein (TIGR03437 family)
LIVEPSDTTFETVTARIQVAAPAVLTLAIVSGNQQKPVAGQPLSQPVVIRVTDGNNLPYPGVKVRASVTSGGKLPDEAILSDEDGLARFQWTPGPGPVNQLTAVLDGVTGGPSVTAVALGAPGASAVVNAASSAFGISPGSLATVYGSNLAAGATAQAQPPLPTELAGVMLLLDGNPAPLLYVSDGPINFFVPWDLAEETTALTVRNLGGTSAPVRVPVVEVQPGIFFDAASGFGAVRAVGGVLEIYCTGLGPVTRSARGLDETLNRVTARIGNSTATVTYSGLAPGAAGLYQVNAVVPSGVSGTTTLQLTVAGQPSNEVKIQLF